MSKKKISVTKLCEYLSCEDPARREAIIKYQKRPIPDIARRYAIAKKAMMNYITSGYDEKILDAAIDELVLMNPSDLPIGDHSSSIEALELFMSIDLPDLDDCEFELRTHHTATRVDIEGLSVSVNPNIVIRRKRRKQDQVGCIKMNVSKLGKLSEDGLKYLSTLLNSYCIDHIASDSETVRKDLCIGIDCFSENYEIAPKAYIMTMKKVKAGCREIVSRWDMI